MTLGLHVRERLRLVDVRLDLRQHVARPDDRALADLQREDPARDRGLDVHFGDGIDDPDLADRDLEVFGLDLAQPEGRLRPCGSPLSLLFAATRATPTKNRTTVRIAIHFFRFTKNPPKAEKTRATTS